MLISAMMACESTATKELDGFDVHVEVKEASFPKYKPGLVEGLLVPVEVRQLQWTEVNKTELA